MKTKACIEKELEDCESSILGVEWSNKLIWKDIHYVKSGGTFCTLESLYGRLEKHDRELNRLHSKVAALKQELADRIKYDSDPVFRRQHDERELENLYTSLLGAKKNARDEHVFRHLASEFTKISFHKDAAAQAQECTDMADIMPKRRKRGKCQFCNGKLNLFRKFYNRNDSSNKGYLQAPWQRGYWRKCKTCGQLTDQEGLVVAKLTRFAYGAGFLLMAVFFGILSGWFMIIPFILLFAISVYKAEALRKLSLFAAIAIAAISIFTINDPSYTVALPYPLKFEMDVALFRIAISFMTLMCILAYRMPLED